MTFSREADVETGYRCPFCPHHGDDRFVHSEVFGRPICDGCDEELDVFMHEPGRRDDRLIDDVERFMGRPWREVRLLLLRDAVSRWGALDLERPASFAEMFIRDAPNADPWAFVRHRLDWVRASLHRAETEPR